jgi:hypothetical protein
MFERLRVLYATGRLGLEGLNAAVARGWITIKELDEIVSQESP